MEYFSTKQEEKLPTRTLLEGYDMLNEIDRKTNTCG